MPFIGFIFLLQLLTGELNFEIINTLIWNGAFPDSVNEVMLVVMLCEHCVIFILLSAKGDVAGCGDGCNKLFQAQFITQIQYICCGKWQRALFKHQMISKHGICCWNWRNVELPKCLVDIWTAESISILILQTVSIS